MTQKERIHRRRQYARRRRLVAAGGILVLLLLVPLLVFLLQMFASPASTRPESSPPVSQSTITTKPAETTAAPTTPPTRPAPDPAMDAAVTAAGAVVFDVSSGQLLYSKAGEERMYPASMTKLLTAVTALRYGGEELIYTVGDELELVAADASRANIQLGWKMTFSMLLDGMMLCSGNDAAYTVAVNVARSLEGNASLGTREAVAAFADLMNRTAAEIGLTNSHFSTPDGYHADDHYSTPEDMAKVMRHVLTIPQILTSMQKTRSSIKVLEDSAVTSFGNEVTWRNSNALINPDSDYYFQGCLGGKTGFTTPAGQCMAVAAERNGRQIVAIVMKAGTSGDRFADAVRLLNYGFAH